MGYGEDGWKAAAAAEAVAAGEPGIGFSPSFGSAETPARCARCGCRESAAAAGWFLSAYDMMLMLGGDRAG